MQEQAKVACIEIVLRKAHREPEQLWRRSRKRAASGCWAITARRVARCVCDLQGRRLCGVCALHRRVPRAGVLLFPETSYRDGLALLKLGAMELKRERLGTSALAWLRAHAWQAPQSR